MFLHIGLSFVSHDALVQHRISKYLLLLEQASLNLVGRNVVGIEDLADIMGEGLGDDRSIPLVPMF